MPRKKLKPQLYEYSMRKNEEFRVLKYFPDLSLEVSSQLKRYFELLMDFNQRINLISRTSEDPDFDHFYDGIMSGKKVLSQLKGEETIFDFGSGNGFPGLIWAILDRSKSYLLIDKNTKKIEFLKYVIRDLKLFHVETFRGSFSSLEKNSCFYGVTRGVSSISEMIEDIEPIFKEKGELYFLKGPSWEKEVENVKKSFSVELFSQYEVPKIKKNCHIIKGIKCSTWNK